MLKTHNFVCKELQETFQNERTIERRSLFIERVFCKSVHWFKSYKFRVNVGAMALFDI